MKRKKKYFSRKRSSRSQVSIFIILIISHNIFYLKGKNGSKKSRTSSEERIRRSAATKSQTNHNSNTNAEANVIRSSGEMISVVDDSGIKLNDIQMEEKAR